MKNIIKNLLHKYIFGINLINEPYDFFIKYQEHKFKQISTRLVLIILFVSSIVTAYAISGLTLRFQLNIDPSAKKWSMLGLIIFNFFELVVMIPIFIYLYIFCDLKSTKMMKVNASIQNFWLNQMCLRTGITLCLSVWVGDCTNDHNHYFCNSLQSVHGLPNNIGMQLFLFPIVMPLMFSCIQIDAIISAWMIALCSFIISCSILGWTQELVSLTILSAITSLLVIVELERQQLKLFKTTSTLEENQRQAKEAHATEMRYMISNVAHDLKTVSHYYR